MTKQGMKNEYFNNDSSLVPELNKPTIDFIDPIFKPVILILTHIIFL